MRKYTLGQSNRVLSELNLAGGNVENGEEPGYLAGPTMEVWYSVGVDSAVDGT